MSGAAPGASRLSQVPRWSRSMKKILATTVAIAPLAPPRPAPPPALGYRPPYKPPAYAAPLYNWTGFYIGAHAGGAFSSDNNFSGLGTGNNGNGRFVGGLHGGGGG